MCIVYMWKSKLFVFSLYLSYGIENILLLDTLTNVYTHSTNKQILIRHLQCFPSRIDLYEFVVRYPSPNPSGFKWANLFHLVSSKETILFISACNRTELPYRLKTLLYA